MRRRSPIAEKKRVQKREEKQKKKIIPRKGKGPGGRKTRGVTRLSTWGRKRMEGRGRTYSLVNGLERVPILGEGRKGLKNSTKVSLERKTLNPKKTKRQQKVSAIKTDSVWGESSKHFRRKHYQKVKRRGEDPLKKKAQEEISRGKKKKTAKKRGNAWG